ncbi:MAG: Ni/Fe-hydrogenase cytochrome b subunit [Vicinamibacteria bacterium]|jgi:Ni/Fe-hydrogenase subunit HybB-like protein|nr:Ni/Fe-hydrogenase cytochrome b subunit [Vicinamibacteria bacterium]
MNDAQHGLAMRFWRGFGALLVLLFVAVSLLRFTRGLGATTNLSDSFPWGIWVGFDVLCGVGLAAGAFTLTAVVHIFNLKQFEPIVRPTVLTGFLGYSFVSIALLFDLGQPWRIWHAMVYWNPHSVMFEVAWCVMLYSTVLAVEFSPVVFERFKLKTPKRIVHSLTTPLVILGVVLSTLHQSSLGTLYLIVPSKLYPLWYSRLLPLFFYLSAIGAGLGMVVLESRLSERVFGHRLKIEILEPLARAMVVILSIYGVLRLLVLRRNGVLGNLLHPGYEETMFFVEFALGVIIPVALLARYAARINKNLLTMGALSAVLGFIMNRLNVSITGMERAAGVRYIPSWMELVVSLGLVAIGFAVFTLAVNYLPVFADPHKEESRA